MSVALYRKYRPSEFNEMIGQEHIVKAIKNAIKYDKISHAYLFTGPRGVGKTTMARLIAKSVNGVDEESIEEISKGTHVDVIEIDAASNRGVNEIRNLRENIKYLPLKGNKKIYIIDEVHMLTNEAFNALLKTLEEPPKHAIFILATTEIEKIPVTVISRCQRYDFTTVSENDVIKLLESISVKENINISTEALSLVYQKSEGSVRDAFSIYEKLIDSCIGEEITKEKAEEILGFVPSKILEEFLCLLNEEKLDEILNYTDNLWRNGINIEKFLKSFCNYLKKYDSKYIKYINVIYNNLFKFKYEEDKKLIVYLILKELFIKEKYIVETKKEIISSEINEKVEEVENNKESISEFLDKIYKNGHLAIYGLLCNTNLTLTKKYLIIDIGSRNEKEFIYKTLINYKSEIVRLLKEFLGLEIDMKITYNLEDEEDFKDETVINLVKLFKGSIKK